MDTWKQNHTTTTLNKKCQNTLVSHLGIQVTEVGQDFIKATMPVNKETSQPFGFLHGGATCVLAETLGSIASQLSLNDENQIALGTQIKSTHLKSVPIGGTVTGIIRIKSLTCTEHSWNIDVYDERDRLINQSTLSCRVVKKR